MLNFSYSYSIILTHSSFIINYIPLYLNVKEYKQKKKSDFSFFVKNKYT